MNEISLKIIKNNSNKAKVKRVFLKILNLAFLGIAVAGIIFPIFSFSALYANNNLTTKYFTLFDLLIGIYYYAGIKIGFGNFVTMSSKDIQSDKIRILYDFIGSGINLKLQSNYQYFAIIIALVMTIIYICLAIMIIKSIIRLFKSTASFKNFTLGLFIIALTIGVLYLFIMYFDTDLIVEFSPTLNDELVGKWLYDDFNSAIKVTMSNALGLIITAGGCLLMFISNLLFKDSQY